jgi:hypothetical protein
MKRLRLERRTERPEAIGGGWIGHLLDEDNFICYTLERGWNDNRRMVSCIPAGDYLCEMEYSGRFDRPLYELRDVPGRAEIKIHVANFTHQLQGCIALGAALGRDDLPIKHSRTAVNKFHERLERRSFVLEVRHADNFIPENQRLAAIRDTRTPRA